VKAAVIVVLLVALGIVGGWVGYWLGHALGWTVNAEWPLRIGGGERAIVLSAGLSFLSVMAGLGWLIVRPQWRNRRLLASGVPARATVVKVWRTGVSTGGLGGSRRELGFDLTVHPASGFDYGARSTRFVHPAEMKDLVAGAEVSVRCDPKNPARVAVEGLASR